MSKLVTPYQFCHFVTKLYEGALTDNQRSSRAFGGKSPKIPLKAKTLKRTLRRKSGSFFFVSDGFPDVRKTKF